jgi:tetratricopeptide (TPR) repeat protein
MDLRVEIAGVLLFGKKYDEAERRFGAILESDSVSLDTKIRIGDMYYGMLEKDSTLTPATVALFSRIQKDRPDDWRSYWYLGLIGSSMRNDSMATRNFLGMTQKAPRNPDGWVSLASTYLGKNDFAEIVRILEPTYKKIDNDFRIPFLLGIAYSRLNRSEDAVIVLEKARTLSPRNADIVAQLALVYDGLRRYSDSDSLYEMVLRLEPNNHLALNNYGYSLAERNQQLERALAMSTRAVEAQPDNPSYLDTIGWIYYRLGDYTRALEFVAKAVEKGDVSAVVLEHLGDIHLKLGNRTKAMEFWNKSLSLDSKNTALKDKVDRGSL